MSILRNLARKWASERLRRKLVIVEADLNEATEEIVELRGELLKRGDQIERQADLFGKYRAEIAALKTSLSGVHEQLRQERAARARAEQEAAKALRLHQARRLA